MFLKITENRSVFQEWSTDYIDRKDKATKQFFEELFLEHRGTMPSGKTRIWRLSATLRSLRFQTTEEQGSMRSRLVNPLIAQPLRQSRGWVCQRCPLQSHFRWQSSVQSTTASNTKPYYITSPIFYVNAGKDLWTRKGITEVLI